jgi:hypothetical protein
MRKILGFGYQGFGLVALLLVSISPVVIAQTKQQAPSGGKTTALSIQAPPWTGDLDGMPPAETCSRTCCLSLVIDGALAKGGELGEACTDRAGHSIEGGVVLGVRLVEVLRVKREVVPESVEIDAFATGDQTLHIGTTKAKLPSYLPAGLIPSLKLILGVQGKVFA